MSAIQRAYSDVEVMRIEERAAEFLDKIVQVGTEVALQWPCMPSKKVSLSTISIHQKPSMVFPTITVALLVSI